MKTLTIGREASCNIVIDDPRVSRRHAMLRISTLGKMQIVDMSANGTYVNGVKLKPNVPFPISRKDSVSLAHARQLDLAQVPDPLKPFKIGGLVAIVIIALIVGTFMLAKSCNSASESNYIESTGGGGGASVSNGNSGSSSSADESSSKSGSSSADSSETNTTSEKDDANSDDSCDWVKKKIAEEKQREAQRRREAQKANGKKKTSVKKKDEKKESIDTKPVEQISESQTNIVY